MKNLHLFSIGLFSAFCLISCQPKTKTDLVEIQKPINENTISFESQVKWGEHLVTILDCTTCHTPKIMTDKGPVPDASRFLSGHPSDMPLIDIDRAEIERKGLSVAADLTEWVGPWGVSFAANLTPDETGIGTWTEEQFILSLREGKAKGIPSSRTLLPPMPWQMYGQMTDDEIKAVFAYLKSLKPVNNIVPPPLPPVSSMEQ